MNYLYYQIMLSSPRILKKYTCGADTPDSDELRTLAYIDARNEKGGQLPDYVYKNNREISLNPCKSVGQMVNKSLSKLAEKYLIFREHMIYVENKYFSQWQEVLCKVSPLSIMAVAIKINHCFAGYSDDELKHVIKINLHKTALPYPYLPLLEQLKRNEGMYDLHIHLNGSTELDVVWQEALKQPRSFYEMIQNGRAKKVVKEQYLQVDEDIDGMAIYQYLHLARKLRVLLVEALDTPEEKVLLSYEELKDLMNIFDLNGYVDIPPVNHWYEHPIKSINGQFFNSETSILEQEAFFLIKTLDIVEKYEINAICLHVYLLVQNLVNKYIVQQVNQFGFDQFQKITMNEYRESVEKKDYKKRFLQLEGMHGETLAFIEGRFAPKSDPFKIFELLNLVISDFLKYKCKNNSTSTELLSEDTKDEKTKEYKRLILGLTGHFIKKTEDVNAEDVLHICRFQKNRREYHREAAVIVFLVKEVPMLKKYVRGFDAASNEMHTPPEVFAPVFRYLRRNGFTNFTYHCGEDYVHLLSGIRAIYESIKFLDIGSQNRIGHATAIGICPELWCSRAGERIAIAQGEWLDDLIFCYYILIESTEYQREASRIVYDISKYFNSIYKTDDISEFNMPILIDAWKLRKLDPLIACCENMRNDKYACIHQAEYIEWDEIEEAREVNRPAFQLFEKYHSWKVIKEYDKIIEVEADYLSADVMYYIQEQVLKILSGKNIAIESLPTSNVRISYYENHYEHHIYRWLTGKWKDKSGIRPLVVLGSDDPGIFGTSIQNEYAHVYELLKHKGIQEREIYQMLREINDHSRAYAFYPQDSQIPSTGAQVDCT